jgi:hypothetical protein
MEVTKWRQQIDCRSPRHILTLPVIADPHPAPKRPPGHAQVAIKRVFQVPSRTVILNGGVELDRKEANPCGRHGKLEISAQ